MQGCSVGCTIGMLDIAPLSLVHPCSWQVHGVSIAKKTKIPAGVPWLGVRRNTVFLCRTTVRTCPFASHAVSLDV